MSGFCLQSHLTAPETQLKTAAGLLLCLSLSQEQKKAHLHHSGSVVLVRCLEQRGGEQAHGHLSNARHPRLLPQGLPQQRSPGQLGVLIQCHIPASVTARSDSASGMAEPQSSASNTQLSKSQSLGWRDGSVVKSTDCSSRGPEFNSQHPHGGSQPSVMGSNAVFWCV